MSEGQPRGQVRSMHLRNADAWIEQAYRDVTERRSDVTGLRMAQVAMVAGLRDLMRYLKELDHDQS